MGGDRAGALAAIARGTTMKTLDGAMLAKITGGYFGLAYAESNASLSRFAAMNGGVHGYDRGARLPAFSPMPWHF